MQRNSRPFPLKSFSRWPQPSTRENVQRNSHPFPLKRMIQAIDPLHPQRSTMKIQTTTGPRRFHLQATIQIPIPRPPTQTPTTIQTPDSPRPQRSTANRHNLRSPYIVSGVRLSEPAPLDWPMSQPILLKVLMMLSCATVLLPVSESMACPMLNQSVKLYPETYG